MGAKKKKVASGGGKKSTPKARRVTVSPARRRNVDPGWAWDDRLPLSQAKQIGNTIYVSGQIAYDSDGKLVGEGDMKVRESTANCSCLGSRFPRRPYPATWRPCTEVPGNQVEQNEIGQTSKRARNDASCQRAS